MAEFVCDRCGKCCVSLGRHIRAERQLNDGEYYCRSAVDRAIFLVHVAPEYRGEVARAFADREEGGAGGDTAPCIFLQQNPDGSGPVCAIHETRPPVCRNFRCYRMVIFDREGKIRGRVVGKDTLRSTDETLQGLWVSHIATLTSRDPGSWNAQMEKILSAHGYRAEPVG